MNMRRAMLALALCGWVAGAAAEMYQWTDRNGTHYGDRPPAGAKNVRPIDLPPTNTTQPPPALPRHEPPPASAVPAPQPEEPPSDAECNAKFAEADRYEKSDRSDLARPIYDWMVTHCPQNRGPNIRSRRLLGPTDGGDAGGEECRGRAVRPGDVLIG